MRHPNKISLTMHLASFEILPSAFFAAISFSLTVCCVAQMPIPYGNFPISYDGNNAIQSNGEALPIVADFRGNGGRQIAIGAHTFGQGNPRMYLFDLNGSVLPG